MRPAEPDAVDRLAASVQPLADRQGVTYLVVAPHPKRVTGFVGTIPTAVREDQADADDRANVVRRIEPARR